MVDLITWNKPQSLKSDPISVMRTEMASGSSQFEEFGERSINGVPQASTMEGLGLCSKAWMDAVSTSQPISVCVLEREREVVL